jgi:hypothetical protein
MFEGRKLVIATKHGKESVISTLLEETFGVITCVPNSLDTDVLGTFSGEVERIHDPLTTARLKCQMAMDIANCDLAIASEGSFGPHPALYFVPADDELLLFVDKLNALEIVVREISTNTNFKGGFIQSGEELLDFASRSNFPSHALIIKAEKNGIKEARKGIMDQEMLLSTFIDFQQRFGKVYVETDMRAMHNPTRMDVIRNATLKLIEKINSKCPKCELPGFSITDRKTGLPCEICNWPTQSTLSFIYHCQGCSYSLEVKFPNGKTTEEALYCDLCNP